MNPAALNRVTIIAAAQLTDETATARPQVNGRGWQTERAIYFGELQRHGIAGPVLTALPGPERKTAAERAKRAVACMLWMADVPVGRIEQQLMWWPPPAFRSGALEFAKAHGIACVSLVDNAWTYITRHTTRTTQPVPIGAYRGSNAASSSSR